MDYEKKSQLVEQGFTEAEAEFLLQNYGDMDFDPADVQVYMDRANYFDSQIARLTVMGGVDTASKPLSVMLESVDIDTFVSKMSDAGDGWELVDLPSGRFAEIYY